VTGGERPAEEGQGAEPLVQHRAEIGAGGVAVYHKLLLEVQHLQYRTRRERLF